VTDPEKCARCGHHPSVHATSKGRPATARCFQNVAERQPDHSYRTYPCDCPAFVPPAEQEGT